MINNAKQPFHSLLHRLFDSTIFNYTLSYVTLVFYQTRLKNRKKSQLKDRNSVKKVIRANRIIRIILSRVENFIPEKRKKTKRKENCDEGEGEEIPSRMLSGTTLRLAEDKRLATNFKMPRIPMSFPFPFPSLFYIYIYISAYRHTVHLNFHIAVACSIKRAMRSNFLISPSPIQPLLSSNSKPRRCFPRRSTRLPYIISNRCSLGGMWPCDGHFSLKREKFLSFSFFSFDLTILSTQWKFISFVLSRVLFVVSKALLASIGYSFSFYFIYGDTLLHKDRNFSSRFI